MRSTTPARCRYDSRWHLNLPDADAVRKDLAASLEDTLTLLADAPETDEGLYFFRLALFHEDMHAEAAVYMAQSLGFDPRQQPPVLLAAPRKPQVLHIAATEWTLGYDGPGFCL